MLGLELKSLPSRNRAKQEIVLQLSGTRINDVLALSAMQVVREQMGRNLATPMVCLFDNRVRHGTEIRSPPFNVGYTSDSSSSPTGHTASRNPL